MASQGGFTALMMAAWHGHKDTVELLLDRGADLEAKDWVSLARVLPWGRTARGHHGRAVERNCDGGGVMACRLPLAGKRDAVPAAFRVSHGC